MPTVKANRKGNSSAEERFIELFCDVFGPERGSMSTCSIRLWTSMADTAPSTMRSIATKGALPSR